MKKLSTGHDSTLKNWRELTIISFGEDSKAVEFLDKMIKEQGEDMAVITDERQLLQVLAQIHGKEE